MQVPVLETPEGPLFESNAMARYGTFLKNLIFVNVFLKGLKCIRGVDVTQLLVTNGLLVNEMNCVFPFAVAKLKDVGLFGSSAYEAVWL